jgi:prepilin-type N-terminal cleavage/methylation domain-containing protein
VNKCCGVTLVELLVVLAVVSILLALLLPAVQSARERGREAVCKNNLHQINLAIARFSEAHKRLPRPSAPKHIGGWMVEILPFIEQQNLKRSVPVGLPVADAPAALYRPPSLFRCPRRTVIDGAAPNAMWPGHYVLVTSSGRESFMLFDAPLDLDVPWISSPELPRDAFSQSIGPHSEGFFFARGFQQGVDFMPNGREVR